MEQTYVLSDAPRDGTTRFVHIAECQVRPGDGDVTELGSFNDCGEAIAAARKKAETVDGCALCCPDCHSTEGGLSDGQGGV